MDINERMDLMQKLSKVVKNTGDMLLSKAETDMEIVDIKDYKGHEESSIDHEARRLLQENLDRFLPELQGVLRFELLPFEKKFIERCDQAKTKVHLIIDEIDGTTNTKRAMAGALWSAPEAAICVALAENRSLSSLQLGVIYTLDKREIYSAVRTEKNNFMSFRNDKVIFPSSVYEKKGDSQNRVLVIGYSNKERIKKALVEQALWDNCFKVYEGCRSSAMDIIKVIRNQFDAYIDPRALWPKSGAMLQVYDVAAVIPIALGCGLCVSDIHGQSWEKYDQDDSIPLLVSRRDINPKLLETLKNIKFPE